MARILAEQVGRAQGRDVIIIENRPGAATAIGTEAVARAEPDGNTLLINGGRGALIYTPNVRKVKLRSSDKLRTNLLPREVPPTIIVVPTATSPYRTLADLLDGARTKPGALTLASFGPATAEQIVFETLKRASNVKMTFVPYPGYAPAVSVLLGEHVTSVLADYSASAQQLAAGNLRALVTLARTRIEALPHVPTMAELGYKDPSNTRRGPDYVCARKDTEGNGFPTLPVGFTAAIKVPELRERLVGQGFYPVGMCGADFSALIRKEYEEFGRASRELNFKAE